MRQKDLLARTDMENTAVLLFSSGLQHFAACHSAKLLATPESSEGYCLHCPLHCTWFKATVPPTGRQRLGLLWSSCTLLPKAACNGRVA